MTCVEQFILVVGLRSGDSLVKQSVDIGRKRVGERIEVHRHVLDKVKIMKLLAHRAQLLAYLADRLHIDFNLNTEFAGKDIYQFKGRSSRATAKPPYVGVEYVYTVYHGHERRSQSVAGRTVSVEVHRHTECSLKLGHYSGYTRRIDQSGHILKRYYLGAISLHSLGLLHKVFVSKYLLGLLAEEFAEKSFRFFLLRIYRVANSSVGNAAELVDHAYRLLNIVKVVKSVKYTHHVKTVLDSLGIKAFEHGVGIRNITKQVTTARKGRQKRASFHGLAHLAQTVPRRLVEITHYRVGHSTAPHFHDIEIGIFIQRQQPVNTGLRHTGSKQ